MLRKLVLFLVCVAVIAAIGVIVKGKTAPKATTDKWGVTYIDNSTFVTEYYFSTDVDDAIADFRGAHVPVYEIVDVCNVSKFTCP
jgi:hypothetical protein